MDMFVSGGDNNNNSTIRCPASRWYKGNTLIHVIQKTDSSKILKTWESCQAAVCCITRSPAQSGGAETLCLAWHLVVETWNFTSCFKLYLQLYPVNKQKCPADPGPVDFCVAWFY